MHRGNLTDAGEDPATDKYREDKLFARRFRASTRVQRNPIDREKRSAHQNRDMKSYVFYG